MATITDVSDSQRGCGWRKEGGLYLIAGGAIAPCGKLPVPLQICPTCGGGIHFARSWTWVNGTALLTGKECVTYSECSNCPLGGPIGRVGLLWIGAKFYDRPSDWTSEAVRQGISRRIASVPHGFEIGKTWVLVAHVRCIENPDGSFTPGIFHAFRPSEIQYVVKSDDPEEKLDAMEKRGITLVRVHRQETAPLFGHAEAGT